MSAAAAREVLSFSLDDHPVDALQRAAYRFMDKFTVEIDRVNESVTCALHPLRTLDDPAWSQIVHEFRVEVLDQVLRARIARETEGIRNVILAAAFSRTGLIEE